MEKCQRNSQWNCRGNCHRSRQRTYQRIPMKIVQGIPKENFGKGSDGFVQEISLEMSTTIHRKAV